MNTFTSLGLKPAWVDALTNTAITVPTPVQQQLIGPSLAGKDVIAQAPTGSGKTLAYLLPLLQQLDCSRREAQAIIMAPTYELCMQIVQTAKLLAAAVEPELKIAALIGDANLNRQLELLKAKPQLLVGSSGRLLDLIKRRKINTQTIRILVLDEGDRLLSDQHYESVSAVIKTTLNSRQLILTSATLNRVALERAAVLMREPVMLELSQTPATITHQYIIGELRDKLELLRKLLRSLGSEPILIFTNRPEQAAVVVERLTYLGISAAALTKTGGKQQRQQALTAFRTHQLQVLVATDLAARGLDILEISCVINLELPDNAQAYLHRAGRTGRAGRSGLVVSIVTKHESEQLLKYQTALKIQFDAVTMLKGKLIKIKR